MNKLNTQAKRAFYTARKRNTDSKKLSDMTSYSQSHIVNVLAGRKNNDFIVDKAYKISRLRKLNTHC